MNISKMYIFKDCDKHGNYLYVIYDDYNVKVIKSKNRNRMNNAISTYMNMFSKQEKCDAHELINSGKVIISRSNELRKEIDSKKDSMDLFQVARGSYNLFGIMSLWFSLTSIFFNRVVSLGYSIDKPPIQSSLSSIMSFAFSVFLDRFESQQTGKKYNKYKLGAATFFAFSSIALIDSLNLPPIQTIPYYYETVNTNIDDTGDYSNLNDKEYHDKAVSVVFENLHNNPYISDDDYDILMKLDKFCAENPYIDCDLLLQRLLTIRHRSLSCVNPKYLGSYNRKPNIISTYIDKDIGTNYEEVLLHEAVHSIGSFDTRFLDEGMTSLIVSEYFTDGIVNNGYVAHVQVTKLFCDLIGSDTMLQAYSMENEDVVREKLLELFGNENYVNGFYELCQSVADSKSSEDYQTSFFNVLLTLDNIIPDRFDSSNYIENSILKNKGYLSEDYKKYVKNYN